METEDSQEEYGRFSRSSILKFKHPMTDYLGNKFYKLYIDTEVRIGCLNDVALTRISHQELTNVLSKKYDIDKPFDEIVDLATKDHKKILENIKSLRTNNFELNESVLGEIV